MRTLDLDPIWRVVEAQVPEPGRGRFLGVGIHTAEGEILAAVDEDGARVVLLPALADEPFASDTSTKVHLTRRTLRTNSGDQTYIAVTCNADRVKPAFTTMAAEMIIASENATQPGTVVSRLLNDWRDLLSGQQRPILTESKLVGLAAELVTLQQALSSDPTRDIGVWTGPEQAVHDFQRGGSALEVKGTLNREGLIVRIHGLRQLEAPQNGTLHLVVYRFEEAQGHGASIPDLVRAVMSLGVAPHEFVRRLGLLGYDMADEAVYADFRLSTVERRVYRVDDQFPRVIRNSLVGGDVPLGVMSIRYSVDLTGPSPSPLPYGEADVALKLMAPDS